MSLVLVQCEMAGQCEMCDDYTVWRLPDDDVHLCSDKCYAEAEESGLIAMMMKRVKVTTRD